MRYKAESFVICMSVSLSTPWLYVLRSRCRNCNRHQQRLRSKLCKRESWVEFDQPWPTLITFSLCLGTSQKALILFFLMILKIDCLLSLWLRSPSLIVFSLITIDLGCSRVFFFFFFEWVWSDCVCVFKERHRALREKEIYVFWVRVGFG